MPVSRPTSVAFGGPNLDVLYVTSMRLGLTNDQLKQQPAAGSIFAVTGLRARGKPPGGRKVRLPHMAVPPPTQPPSQTVPQTHLPDEEPTHKTYPDLDQEHTTTLPTSKEEHGELYESEHEEDS